MWKLGLLNVLTVVFVVLKLTAVIAWSWFLVLLPTIIAAVGAVLMFGISLWLIWLFTK
jgi:hypothetical protein